MSQETTLHLLSFPAAAAAEVEGANVDAARPPGKSSRHLPRNTARAFRKARASRRVRTGTIVQFILMLFMAVLTAARMATERINAG